MTTKRSAETATIFSRVWAPPPPLTSQRSGVTWSVPSIAMSSRSSDSNGSTGRPSSFACSSVATEVATQRRPSSLRSARAGSRKATVEPVPRPTAIPASTSAAARTAASFLASSAEPMLAAAYARKMSTPGAAESVIPESPYIRKADGERRATYFELFFDLVYVFAVTQLSHHLLGELTWEGAAQTGFLLLAVYWAWNYTTWMTNWFDPETGPVRLVLSFVMLASLLMAVAIPEGFGDRAMLFAASYCALQIGRNAFVVAVDPSGPFHATSARS